MQPLSYLVAIVCQAVFLLICFSTANTILDFYSFTVRNIRGEEESLEKYRGKVSLVVNVASECGYTDSHYTALVELQDALGRGGKFNVLAFPSNEFGKQEPGTNEQILGFAQRQFNVNFPMFAKVNVFTEPAFKNLADQSGKKPDWNFWKYLINADGRVVHAWGPRESVETILDKIVDEVEKLPSQHHEL